MAAERKSLYQNVIFWLALAIVAATAVLFFMVYDGQLNSIYAEIYSVPVHHWLSWIGASFIAIYTPAFYYLKRRYRKSYQTFVKIHVLGNLVSFMLVSVHFSHHLREYVEVIPHPGTGVPLYAALVLLVLTGFVMRFQFIKRWLRQSRSVHLGFTMAFYLIIVFHVLVGTNIL